MGLHKQRISIPWKSRVDRLIRKRFCFILVLLLTIRIGKYKSEFRCLSGVKN